MVEDSPQASRRPEGPAKDSPQASRRPEGPAKDSPQASRRPEGPAKDSRHLSRDVLEAYVIGALEDVDTARVESHVTSCASCAERLAREAQLEIAFTQVAVARAEERTHGGPHRIPFAASLAAAGAALAMAAAMLVWLAPRTESEAHTPQVEETASPTEIAIDASTFTAQLDVQSDGASRVGVRD